MTRDHELLCEVNGAVWGPGQYGILLEEGHSGKGVAGTAIALVFDFCEGWDISPIELIGNWGW